MAPRTRIQKRAVEKEPAKPSAPKPVIEKKKKEAAGPSKKKELPLRKLIIHESSDDTSAEDNVPLTRMRGRLVNKTAVIDLNTTPVAQSDARPAEEEERSRQEKLADELDEEMQASSEEEREKEKKRKKEEEKKIDEEINRWAEEFEEEFNEEYEREEREEQEAQARAQETTVPQEMPTGTKVADSEEADATIVAGSSRFVPEASGASTPRAPRVRVAPVPAALRSPKKKRPTEREPAKRAEPSKKKNKKLVEEEVNEELWMEDWMVSVVAAKRYEYIGYKDFEQEQGFQPREQEAFIKKKLEHH